MPVYVVGRKRVVFETYLVEADSAVKAKALIDTGRQLDVINKKVQKGSEVATRYKGLDCEDGEQVFEVVVPESHRQTVLIVAKTPDEAIMKVREGDGEFLHGTEYAETEDPENWTVYNKLGNIVS